MAKFGEEHLFKYIGIKNFFRVPITFGKNHFWVNIGRNSVVKIHELKLLHTWTLTHPHSFTCPVVFRDDDESLCCILDENTLIKWDSDDDTLNSAVKIKFQESAFAIIPVHEEEPLIIFKSGKFITIVNALIGCEPGGQIILKPNELIWADVAVIQNEVVIYCLGYTDETKLYQLHSFTVDKGTQNATNYNSQSISREVAVLRNWCLNRHNFSFLTVWSDGVVLSHKTSDQTPSTLLSIPNEENNLLAIDVVDFSHIITVKTSPKCKESCLEIWDSKFSVLKIRKVLKVPCSDFLQILVLNFTLFLRSNEDLISIPFIVEKSTLSAAIGKSGVATSKILEFCLNEEGKLLPASKEEQNSIEAMDTSTTEENSVDSIELTVQKLTKENPEYVKYIPESELVRLLLLSIRCLEQKNVQTCMENYANIILCIVFSTSFSDVFLVKYLKKLNLEDTMIALNALLSFLNDAVHISSYECKKPSDLQIFSWTCLIIQSHMEALSFSKDKSTTKLLQMLNKALSDKMKYYEDLEEIQNYFHIIEMKKNILPEKSIPGKYCIESLNL